ncbi:peptidase M64 [candidate division KSB1 bacterium]|nr:peptidase M64 [candidate division KSB1 bacterium]
MSTFVKFFAILIFPSIGLTSAPCEDFFTDFTMRVDYFVTGNASQEFYSLDRIYQEGEWSGNRKSLIDSSNLGGHYVRVYDPDTNQLLFSRGYCTMFSEWKTTEEAQSEQMYTMHETVRFPFPRKSVHLDIEARDRKNQFYTVFSMVIDPHSQSINKEKKCENYKSYALRYNGDPARKVDVVILGDGYTKKEMKSFRKSAQKYTKALFEIEPYVSCRECFNIWLVETISRDSGIDLPGEGIWRDTALGTSYYTFGSPRYLLPVDNKAIRDAASVVPYDCIVILTNSARYGGGGIYNWIATCYTGKEEADPAWWSEYVFTHEFGHLFTGLGDEYYTSDVAYSEFYPTDVEPWEPNITALLPQKPLKWQDQIGDTPVPTPWAKAEYDSLDQARRTANDSVRLEIAQKMKEILQNKNLTGVVGCFEGAGYASHGLYRPAIDCRMFSKSLVDFCPVCSRAIKDMIYFYTK